MNVLNNLIKEYVYPRDNEEVESYKKNLELVSKFESMPNVSDALQHSQCFASMYVNMHQTIQQLFCEELRRLSGRQVTIRYAMERGIMSDNTNNPGCEFKTFWSVRTNIEFSNEELLVKEPVFLHSGIRSFYITVFSVALPIGDTRETIVYHDSSTVKYFPRFKFLAYI